jgi:hypothetical protein
MASPAEANEFVSKLRQRSVAARHVWALGVILLLVLGCAEQSADAPAERVRPAFKLPKLTELPKLGDPIGPLDRGSARISPPEGWHVATTPGYEFLARFQFSKTQRFPAIMLKATDYPQIPEVTRKNVKTFAEQVAEEIDEAEGPGKLMQPVEPLVYETAGGKASGFVGITFARRGKVKGQGMLLERVFLETVAGGRRYTLELRTLEGTAERYWPTLLAVALGMEFLNRDSTEPKTDEKKTDEKKTDKSIPPVDFPPLAPLSSS